MTAPVEYKDVRLRQRSTILLSLQSNNDSPERLLPFTVGGNIPVILKRRMNYSSLIGIHRLQGNRALCPLYLVSDIFCKVLQRFLPSLPIVLGIDLYPDIFLRALIHHKGNKILQRIQRLSSLSDEDSHLVAA